MMRALFTTQPGSGMFTPLIPFLRALKDAGHEVAVACAASFRPEIKGVDVPAFPAGLDWRADALTQSFPDAPPPGPDRTRWVTHHWRYTTARAMVPDLLTLATAWKPDLFVREGTEFGACLTAEILGLPHASAGALWFRTQTALTAPLDALRHELHLPPDPSGDQQYRYLALASMPPTWIAGDEEAPPTAHFLRPHPDDDRQVPDWLAALPTGRPLIHATMGTTEVNRTPGIYEAILAGLREEPCELVLAIGRQRDPVSFGLQPKHVRIEHYVSHALLLPRCDLVITHGGFGTVMGCLAAGIPMVVIPVQGDQPRNAQRCADLGVGHVIRLNQLSPDTIRTAVRTVLANPSYRANAAKIRDEIAMQPGMEHAVALLEQLAVERQPLFFAAAKAHETTTELQM